MNKSYTQDLTFDPRLHDRVEIEHAQIEERYRRFYEDQALQRRAAVAETPSRCEAPGILLEVGE